MTLPDVSSLLDVLVSKTRAHFSTMPEALQNVQLVGLHTGGVWVAEAIARELELPRPVGTLDIGFWRDDFYHQGLAPNRRSTSLPFDIEGAHILLVDDVIMSGRTIRAAMNELFDFGRPERITLVSLIALPGRELPIQPDVVGLDLSLPAGQRIKLTGPDPLMLTLKET
ncbi:bifunctional pyr operon transcriptional regulator/uracil phosphoribosyltransferase PyrR [Larsenimonas rhizosphaerae]|uniref:Bifunctional pyr operon transcriptional regulator/uracil phosphoribosyltransferase PyrR n=1 Tax=Larsenimonas rhizosphaerae TaxID=2944682 RepID=A0AA42CXL0_9GAMM|nr:bifunctional pyr operon transcriptional regulator/uracil phosphoribosyltransferase PyrR [Larsenimonas rhizosphaerae]MCX2524000.1 bifunctional pyr operon transcriptional regulator/uracil phosphoribosyltransferase PyrR [Larsenimonas rhizosphaerae]